MTDDELRSFLDYVARHEGTANQPNGGYNTTLGYGQYLPGGKEVDLSSMRLADVDKLQKQMLSNAKNPFNSSAAGRYQIVNKTLRGLIDKMGLDWNDKFSPAVQDAMGATLAGARGNDPAGLRQEWQGLNRRPAEEISEYYAKGTSPAPPPPREQVTGLRNTQPSAQPEPPLAMLTAMLNSSPPLPDQNPQMRGPQVFGSTPDTPLGPAPEAPSQFASGFGGLLSALGSQGQNGDDGTQAALTAANAEAARKRYEWALANGYIG